MLAHSPLPLGEGPEVRENTVKFLLRYLVALWREALLAQKVLKGETKGYRHHPQLERFKTTPDPIATIATYLVSVYEDATCRGYHFDYTKIESGRVNFQIALTESQLLEELNHLRAKLQVRNNNSFQKLQSIIRPEAHPLFKILSPDWKSRESHLTLAAGLVQT